MKKGQGAKARKTPIEAERGPCVLFGLFVRSDAPSMVNVVASAKWLDGRSRMSGTRYIVEKISDVLRAKEMLILSRIAPMDTTDAEVRKLVSEVGTVDGTLSLGNFVFAGAEIADARIFSSHEPAYRRSARKKPAPNDRQRSILAAIL